MRQEYLTSWKKWAGVKLPLHVNAPPTSPPLALYIPRYHPVVSLKKKYICVVGWLNVPSSRQQKSEIRFWSNLKGCEAFLFSQQWKKKQETVILLGETWQVFGYVCACVSVVSTVICVSAECENLGTYICSANRVLTSWLQTRSCSLFPKCEVESKLKHSHAVASTPGKWTQRDRSDEAAKFHLV